MHYFTPIITHSIIKCKYVIRNYDLNEHSHDFNQLVLVVAGNGFLSSDDIVYEIKEGDLLFLGPNVKHTFFRKENFLTTYEIKFDIMDQNLAEISQLFPLKMEDLSGSIKNEILEVINEGKRKRKYWQLAISHMISKIIIEILRLNTPDFFEIPELTPKELNLNENSVIIEVKNYLENNYMNKITLDDLASKFALSQSHLCREFTKHFDLSPIKYLNFLRIEKAKELLAITDFSITEIAEKVGFCGIHYFSRYFSKQEKMSPFEYRATLKDGFIIKVTDL